MAKIEKLIADVKKLYAKRTALTAQILGMEAKIAAEVTSAGALAKKPAKASVKSPAAKKGAGTKASAKDATGKKPEGKRSVGRPRKQVTSEK